MFNPEELFNKITEKLHHLNLTDFFGRVLSEGDNNYSATHHGVSHAILASAILNMTHYIYWNDTTFLPGVAIPFGEAALG